MELLKGATRFDRLLFTSDGLRMRIRDQHVDLAFRVLFPVAWAILYGLMLARIPDDQMKPVRAAIRCSE